MRSTAINSALEKSLSTERLTKYLAAAGGDLNKALDLYERNARLAEAFYTPLQCMEICFRNALNDQLVTKYGADWFRPGKVAFANDAIEKIKAVVDELNSLKCAPSAPMRQNWGGE